MDRDAQKPPGRRDTHPKSHARQTSGTTIRTASPEIYHRRIPEAVFVAWKVFQTSIEDQAIWKLDPAL